MSNNNAAGGLAVLFLFGIGFVVYISIVASWELLKLGGQLLVWTYETAAPPIEDAWHTWQRQRLEARKPQYIEQVGKAARNEIDQVMNQYRQQVKQILQTEAPNHSSLSDVIILDDDDYNLV